MDYESKTKREEAYATSGAGHMRGNSFRCHHFGKMFDDLNVFLLRIFVHVSLL